MALADQRLALTDSKVTGDWSRPAVWCQPIHTVYIPANSFFSGTDLNTAPDLPRKWGQEVLSVLQSQPGADSDPYEGARKLAEFLNIEHSSRVAELAVQKLQQEPIEDVRIDFEDGFTQRGVTRDVT